jgi:hypothetical protein
MRLTTLLPSLPLLTLALAAPIPAANVVDVQLRNVNRALSTLDAALRAIPFNGTPDEARRVTNDLVGVHRGYLQSLRSGSSEIKRSQVLSMADTYTLLEGFDKMGNWLQSTMNGWVNAKGMVNVAGKRGEVRDLLHTTLDTSNGFAEACFSKMMLPSAVASAAYQTKFGGLIDSAIKEFSR